MNDEHSLSNHIIDGLAGAVPKGLATLCVALMIPFAVLNLIAGTYAIGAGIFAAALLFLLALKFRDRPGRIGPEFFLLPIIPVVIVFIAMGMFERGVQALVWCYPGIIVFYFLLPQRQAWIANVVLLAVVVPLAIYLLPPSLSSRLVITLVFISVLPALFVNIIERLQTELRGLATRDALTGLLNRASLSESLEYAIEENRRIGIPMTLAAFDVDHFKRINDELGHAGGDAVLVDIAKLLQQRLRKVDKAFRIGGEEFLILFHGTGSEGGRSVAETLRKQISQLNTPDNTLVTASAGVAALREGENYAAWMKRADIHLYAAKAGGRNRVESDIDEQQTLF